MATVYLVLASIAMMLQPCSSARIKRQLIQDCVVVASNGHEHDEAVEILEAGLTGAGWQMGAVEMAGGIAGIVTHGGEEVLTEAATEVLFFSWAGLLHRGIDIVLAARELKAAKSWCEVAVAGGKLLVLGTSFVVKLLGMLSVVNVTGTTGVALAVANGAFDVGMALGKAYGIDPCQEAAAVRPVIPDLATARLALAQPSGDSITTDELLGFADAGANTLQDLVDDKQATVVSIQQIELKMQDGQIKTFKVDLGQPLRGILGGESILKARDLDEIMPEGWNVQPNSDANMWDEKYFMKYGRHRDDGEDEVPVAHTASQQKQNQAFANMMKHHDEIMAANEAWRADFNQEWSKEKKHESLKNAGLREDYSFSKHVNGEYEESTGLFADYDAPRGRIP